MAAPIKLLGIVALTEDLPGQNLWRGQVGTIVDILAAGQPMRSSFVTAMVAPMPHSSYVLSNCWPCSMNRCHLTPPSCQGFMRKYNGQPFP
jgi:hypothetical protein